MSSLRLSSPSLGRLFILAGPPGAGKNTLMNHVLRRLSDLRQLATATTRNQRPTEQQGREHVFISRDEFQQMIDDDELAEWQPVHKDLYGTPRRTLEQAFSDERDLIADIDVLGATALQREYPDNVSLIFIQPPSLDDLIARMDKRGESQADIELRMRRVEMEMQFAPHCDYLITNEDEETASDILLGIVLAERSRREIQKLRQHANSVQLA